MTLIDARRFGSGSIKVLFLGAFVAGLSGAVTPGPLLAACISEVARTGFMASLMLVLGHAIPELVIVIIIALRADWVARAQGARRVVTALGVVALLAMAMVLIRDGLRPETVLELQDARPQTYGHAAPFIAGIVLTILNPYWIVWWATIGATLTAMASSQGRRGVAAFFVGHELSDLAWYALVGFLVSAGRDHFSPELYRGLLVACGVAMLVMAVLFALTLRRRAPEGETSADPPLQSEADPHSV